MKFWSNWFLPLVSVLVLIAAIILFALSFRGLFFIN